MPNDATSVATGVTRTGTVAGGAVQSLDDVMPNEGLKALQATLKAQLDALGCSDNTQDYFSNQFFAAYVGLGCGEMGYPSDTFANFSNKIHNSIGENAAKISAAESKQSEMVTLPDSRHGLTIIKFEEPLTTFRAANAIMQQLAADFVAQHTKGAGVSFP